MPLDGEEALLLLDAYPDICLVLADIRMPGMDGLELLKTIHQKTLLNARMQSVQVIMVSAYSDLPNMRESMRYGAVDFIVKPIVFQALEAAMTRTLREIARRRDALSR